MYIHVVTYFSYLSSTGASGEASPVDRAAVFSKPALGGVYPQDEMTEDKEVVPEFSRIKREIKVVLVDGRGTYFISWQKVV